MRQRPDPVPADDQLSLFDLTPPSRGRDDDTVEPEADWPADVRALGERIPPSVRFGTSSWSFPGWAGIVYRRPRTQTELAREGLREYARYPLFGTVGIDRSYYAPLTSEELKRYASQLPSGFPCCAKVPAMYASPVLPGSGRDSAAIPNPDFLSPEGFLADVVQPFLLHFRHHLGPFVLEIPPVPPEARLEPQAFADRLARFRCVGFALHHIFILRQQTRPHHWLQLPAQTQLHHLCRRAHTHASTHKHIGIDKNHPQMIPRIYIFGILCGIKMAYNFHQLKLGRGNLLQI